MELFGAVSWLLCLAPADDVTALALRNASLGGAKPTWWWCPLLARKLTVLRGGTGGASEDDDDCEACSDDIDTERGSCCCVKSKSFCSAGFNTLLPLLLCDDKLLLRGCCILGG